MLAKLRNAVIFKDMAEMVNSTGVSTGMLDLYAERAKIIESTIDPEDDLPPIVIIRDPEAGLPAGPLPRIKHLVFHDGVEVAGFYLKTNPHSKERWFNGIKLQEQFRNQGLGISIYKEAIVTAVLRGLSFRTDEVGQSEEAKRRWEQFAAIGLARVIEEFRLDELALMKTSYHGHYVIEAVPSEAH